MKQRKKILLYVGALLVSIIIVVLVIIEVNRRNEPDLTPLAEQVLSSEVESSPSGDIETDGSIDQIEPNSAIERTDIKESEPAELFFSEIVGREIRSVVNKIKKKRRLKKHIKSMEKADRECNERWDLPEDVLAETPTDKLFLHFIRSPMVATLTLYSKAEIGVQRQLNASSTLHEFYTRKDLAEGALKMYREYDLSPEVMSYESTTELFSVDTLIHEYPVYMQSIDENMINAKIAEICLNIYFADRIMLSPQFVPKLKGHEREYLSVMLDRYAQVFELSEKYDEDRFGAALACVPRFCRSLAKNIDEELYTKLQAIKHTNKEGKLLNNNS